jgi:hypothetical protein
MFIDLIGLALNVQRKIFDAYSSSWRVPAKQNIEIIQQDKFEDAI